MNKTKIEWCDMTWNPVTGCLHECEYCYASKIARRFASGEGWQYSKQKNEDRVNILDKGKLKENGFIHYNEAKAYYPYGFDPTFHRHRLDEPKQIKKSQNIFVCSMADLFGEWVPEEWIKQVFEACEKAPQHRYLFLTKNPKRYEQFIEKPMPDNMWFGFSQTKNEHIGFNTQPSWNVFMSAEPLLCDICEKSSPENIGWVIIGAESGNRKDKVIPKREWIEKIVGYCHAYDVPVFMKNSLANIWQEPLIQEFPWRQNERPV